MENFIGANLRIITQQERVFQKALRTVLKR